MNVKSKNKKKSTTDVPDKATTSPPKSTRKKMDNSYASMLAGIPTFEDTSDFTISGQCGCAPGCPCKNNKS